MNWNELIGSGDGVFVVLSLALINDGLPNDNFVSALKVNIGLSYEGVDRIISEKFGIYENKESLKASFYRELKNNVFKETDTTFFFNKRFFYSESLSQAQALKFIEDNDVAGLIAACSELDQSSGEEFLNNIL